LPNYIKRYNEGLIEAASSFLEDCLLASPQRGFAHIFEQKKVEMNSSLRDSFRDSLAEFEPDLARWNWRLENPDKLFERLLLAPTLQVVYFYRLSHALFVRNVKIIPDAIATLSRWMTGVEIYYSAKIGPGLKVIHGLGTVIGAESQIGSNFTIYQGVTIGDKLGNQTGLDQRPHISDSVIACAGSAILGHVYIGDKTIIGANSVVMDSLPGRCIAAGSPAVVKVENLSDSKFQKFWTAIKG
jgi:serine O-acetyltransferase